MTPFLLFVLSSVGMTFIIVDSTIMEPVRLRLKQILPEYIYKVFECYQCSGFWCGIISGLILLTHNIFELALCGCAASFLSVLCANILNYLEINTSVDIDK